MKKKLLSMLLVLALVISMTPTLGITAWASADKTKITSADIIYTINAGDTLDEVKNALQVPDTMTCSSLEVARLEGGDLGANDELEAYTPYNLTIVINAKDGYRFPEPSTELDDLTVKVNGFDFTSNFGDGRYEGKTKMTLPGLGEFCVENAGVSTSDDLDPPYDKDDYTKLTYSNFLCLTNYAKLSSTDNYLSLYDEAMTFDTAKSNISNAFTYGTLDGRSLAVYVFAKSGNKYLTFKTKAATIDDLTSGDVEEKTLSELKADLLTNTTYAFGIPTKSANADTYDTSWYNTSDSSFTLYDTKDLEGLALIVRGEAKGINCDSFEGKTIKLADSFNDSTPLTRSIGKHVSSDARPYFKGKFDGNGKTVVLDINTPTTCFVGMFSTVDCGEICNLTVKGKVIGENQVGGIAGDVLRGTLNNCVSHADIMATGSYGYVGGITGCVYSEDENDPKSTIVINCYATSTVSAFVGEVGGIAGHVEYNGHVVNSYFAGKLKVYDSYGDDYFFACGYITGTVYNVGFINNCYATTTIQYLDLDDSKSGEDLDCCGTLTGDFANGYIYNSYVPNNSDYPLTGSKRNSPSLDPACAALTDAQMKAKSGEADALLDKLNSYARSFEGREMGCYEWAIDENINNGYPHLVLPTDCTSESGHSYKVVRDTATYYEAVCTECGHKLVKDGAAALVTCGDYSAHFYNFDAAWQKALALDTSETPATITLLSDCKAFASMGLYNDEDVIIDLNNHVLSGCGDDYIFETEHGNLTITDTAKVKTRKYFDVNESGLWTIKKSGVSKHYVKGGVITGAVGEYGPVLYTYRTGTATLKDVNIVGNTSTKEAGAIENLGKCVIDGCSIVGNRCDGYGGGVANFGKMEIKDTLITQNVSASTCPSAGLYYWYKNSRLIKISGDTKIYDNYTNGVQSNLCLNGTPSSYSYLIDIDDLDDEAYIGVSTMYNNAEDSMEFTAECSAKNLNNFFADNDAYGIKFAADDRLETVNATVKISPKSFNHGYVSVDKPDAAAGETVVITVIPAKGYELKSLTVTDSDGNSIELDGTTFVMPSSESKFPVTVTASIGKFCTYLSQIEAGTNLPLYIGDIVAGKYTITGNNCEGFKLADENGKYIYVSGNSVIKSNNSYTWKYDGGFYTEVKSTVTKKFLFWKKKVTKTTKYYLNYDGEQFLLSNDTVNAQVQLTADKHTYTYLHDNNGEHEAVCIKCGKHEEAEMHDYSYDEANHKCICGKIDPDYCLVKDVKVTEKKTTSTKKFLFWKKTVTKYQYTLKTETQNVAVAKVEYSGNQEDWETGKEFLSDVKLGTFYIKITDTNGKVTNWKYKDGEVKQIDL